MSKFLTTICKQLSKFILADITFPDK